MSKHTIRVYDLATSAEIFSAKRDESFGLMMLPRLVREDLEAAYRRHFQIEDGPQDTMSMGWDDGPTRQVEPHLYIRDFASVTLATARPGSDNVRRTDPTTVREVRIEIESDHRDLPW